MSDRKDIDFDNPSGWIYKSKSGKSLYFVKDDKVFIIFIKNIERLIKGEVVASAYFMTDKVDSSNK